MADTDVKCKANPDVAGPGVIWSFIISAVLTFSLSTATIILRYGLVKGEAARFSERMRNRRTREDRRLGGSAIRRLRDLYQMFSDMLYDNHPFWTSIGDKYRTRSLWHEICDQLLLSIALNQQLSGLAMQICNIIWYGIYNSDPHQDLALSLSTLAIFSQSHVVLLMSREARVSATLRVTENLVFFLLMFASFYGALSAPEISSFWRNYFYIWYAVMGVTIIVPCVVFLLATFASPYRPGMPAILRRRVIWMAAFFAWSTFITLSLIIWILKSKYGHNGKCNLNTDADNKWTMGQMIPFLMLPGLVQPAIDMYYGKDAGEEYWRLTDLKAGAKDSKDAPEAFLLPPLQPSNEEEEPLILDFEPDSIAYSQDAEGEALTASATENSHPIRRTTSGLESQRDDDRP